MTYLYGLIDAQVDAVSEVLDGLEGVTGPVFASRCDRWTVIWGDAEPDAEFLPKRRLLLRHTKVLESVLGCASLLPMRFGVVAGSLGEFEARVLAARPRVTEEFAKVQGKAEYGIRITVEADVALSRVLEEDPQMRAERDALINAGAAHHYAKVDFGQKLGERVQSERQIAQRHLIRAIGKVAKTYVLKAPESDMEVLRAEFLVGTQDEAALNEAIEAAVSECPLTAQNAATVRLLGPAPAFNFVSLSLDQNLSGAA
ncbi:MAG: GvpL/GvpF family gas vesicle protein [Pseudomonadota bacterium]